MDRSTVLALYDEQVRRGARPGGPGIRIERVGGVVRQVGPAEAWNAVVWSDLDPTTADAAITGQVRYFTALGSRFEWKVYGHDRPKDLPERLRAAGFVPEPRETLMVAAVDDLASRVDLPDGVDLRPVADPEDVELLVRVHDEAFGTDGCWLRKHLLTQIAASPNAVVAVVAVAGDRPVSSARLEFCPGTWFVGLWGGGTVPAWRGRGLYRALVAYRARVAAERGYRYVHVDASEQSRPILRRLGFVLLTTTTPYVYEP